MHWKDYFGVSMAVVGTAAGFCFSSGRVQAVFYAQMKETSWMGILAAALFYALLTAMTAYLARWTGASGFLNVYKRLLGIHLGRWIGMLYGFVLVTGGVLLLLTAAKAGSLMLPIPYAGWVAALSALGFALLFAGMGNATLKRLGGSYLVLLLLFEVALWKWGRVPVNRLNFAVNLRLEDSAAAAVLMGLLHACVCSALSAGTVVRFSEGRMHPWRLGMCCGCMLALLTLWGNGALLRHDEKLLALQSPFAVLVSQWGSTGFYACAGLLYLGAVVTLSGIMFSLFKGGPGRNMPEN